MTERKLILLVLLALFAGAWFFGYDSSSGGANSSSASNSSAAPVIGVGAPRPPAGAGSPAAPAAANPGDASTPAPESSPDSGDDPSGPGHGFADDRRLEGTWTLVPGAALNSTASAAATTTTTAPSSADAPSITFHADGAFSEHLLLSTDGLPLRPALHRPDLSGRYTLRGFTLSILRDDPESLLDPAAKHPIDYTISPLAGENDQGMPLRLYIDGKVLEYRK